MLSPAALLPWVLVLGPHGDSTTPGSRTSPRRVVLVHVADETRALPQTEAKVANELSSAGVEVLLVEQPDPGALRLEAVLEAHPDSAVVRVSRQPTRLVGDVLYVFEGQPVVETLDTPPGPDAPTILALRIVEQLNAVWVSVVLPAADTPTKRRPTPPPPPRHRVPIAAVRGGFTVLGAPGGAGALGGPTIGARWGFHRLLALDFDAIGSAVEGHISGADSGAKVGLAVARAQLLVRLRSNRNTSVALGGGAGPMLAWARPQAVEPSLRGRRDVTAVGVVSGSVYISVRPTKHLRLGANVGASAAFPAVRVFFADDVKAIVGRPVIDASLTVGWVWP
ncbi:MAG: hypothetical protein AAF721_17105 [Myxococcota bacterium]